MCVIGIMGDYLVMSLRLSVHTYVYVILSSPALCVSYELIPKSLIGYNVDFYASKHMHDNTKYNHVMHNCIFQAV